MILFWICIFYAVSAVGCLVAVADMAGEITVKGVLFCLTPVLNTVCIVVIVLNDFSELFEYVLWKSKK